jgi:3-oxoacyl-[acyl-carrier-protein] synthase III
MSTGDSERATATPGLGPGVGVRIAGSGMFVPEGRLTNAQLEKHMDTSDEWIRQRTGISERRIASIESGECVLTMATEAARRALDDAGLASSDLDMLILATVGSEMPCPSTACRVMENLGGGRGAALDLVAACSGWVYGLNLAHASIRAGMHRKVLVIGAEHLTKIVELSTRGRGVSILFGDGAGAVVLEADSDASLGAIAQRMHSDGNGWRELYIPQSERDFPEGEFEPWKVGHMQMNGRAVFKFAVKTFCDLIAQTLDAASVDASDVDMFVCHQSNVRILEAARTRFGLPEEKLYINIDRYGNTSAASVPICLDELRKAGRIGPGHKVMFVAFGGGLTWASSLWQL